MSEIVCFSDNFISLVINLLLKLAHTLLQEFYKGGIEWKKLKLIMMTFMKHLKLNP